MPIGATRRMASPPPTVAPHGRWGSVAGRSHPSYKGFSAIGTERRPRMPDCVASLPHRTIRHLGRSRSQDGSPRDRRPQPRTRQLATRVLGLVVSNATRCHRSGESSPCRALLGLRRDGAADIQVDPLAAQLGVGVEFVDGAEGDSERLPCCGPAVESPTWTPTSAPSTMMESVALNRRSSRVVSSAKIPVPANPSDACSFRICPGVSYRLPLISTTAPSA